MSEYAPLHVTLHVIMDEESVRMVLAASNKVKLPTASRGASCTARRGIASPLPLHRIHPRH